MKPAQARAVVRRLSLKEKLYHIRRLSQWEYTRRPDQTPPEGAWLIWILLGGRGAGKTRAGAEWVRAQVKHGARRIALVAADYNDAREVMIHGESGLLNIGEEGERPQYYPSRRLLLWPNGAKAHVFSAEDPEGLRGPQFDCAWADEFCAWRYPKDTLSNLRFALRLGDAPRLVVTTTPKPTQALKELLQEKGVEVSRAATKDNAAYLSPKFMKAVYEAYGGSRLGRQELGGELLEDTQGALWTRALIDRILVQAAPPDIQKIVVAIDPPATSGAKADACGLIIVGRTGCGAKARAYVLFDGTVQGLPPHEWASRAVKLWRQWDADYILAEVNQGGEMVRTIINTVCAEVPVHTVYASKSKTARAEPIVVLYEQGRVKHVGGFPDLEDELCRLGTQESSHKSPDRADALVWAITDLLLKPRPNPSVRSI